MHSCFLFFTSNYQWGVCIFLLSYTSLQPFDQDIKNFHVFTAVWNQVEIVGSIPGDIMATIDGNTATISSIPAFTNPSTSKKIVFGREFVTVDGNYNYGDPVYFDDVKIYNTQLTV